MEEALRDLQGEIDGSARPLLNRLVCGAAAAACLLACVAYLLGRRSGRKRSTIVEVRRI